MNFAETVPTRLDDILTRALLPRAEWFWARVDRSSPGGCWPWLRHINADNGYGRVTLIIDHPTRCFSAHRVAYMLVKGAIPDGHQVDHLCENTTCCNPGHLEVVTRQVNMARQVARHGSTSIEVRDLKSGSKSFHVLWREYESGPGSKRWRKKRVFRDRLEAETFAAKIRQEGGR